MRRASVLKVPSRTREICVFCAATIRQSSSQRRHLTSSSKAPQSAAEAQVHKPEDAPAPPRRLTQAERMRKMLEAQMAKQQPTHPAPRSPVANGGHNRGQTNFPSNGYGSQRQPPVRQPLPQRRPPSNTFGGPGRNDNRERFASGPARRSNNYESLLGRREPLPNEGGIPPRYPGLNKRAEADKSAPWGAAEFGTGQLPRKNAPEGGSTGAGRGLNQENQNERTTTTPFKPQRLDQAELDELLGTVERAHRAYTPLSRELRPQCMHCGREDHLSRECPTKPVLREEPQDEDIVDEFSPSMERRRAKFAMDDSPKEVSNRYEQPERRRRNVERRTRRVTRYDDEEEDGYMDKAEMKRRRKEERKRLLEAEKAAAAPTPISLPEFISVANLAALLRVRVDEFVYKLEELGFEEVQTDHILNSEHAGLIAQEYNFEPIVQTEDEDLHAAPPLSAEEYAELPARPPVVTIMGHVDHGKTTILDYIRSSSVAASEFGGITQHIGAFSVPLASGKKITFLDTPGHSAFETMRARGANVTDIVVLVVAADDSVMPQTVEAIKHAQNAKVPIIVAINKIDKSQADQEAVKLDLGRHGIEVEDFGGDIQAIPVSGKTGQGIPDLEEAIVTLSEMLDHRADPQANVEGWVLEGSTKKSGKVATVLVRSGTLRVGDILVAGTTWARVRTLKNESGVAVDEVGPGMPVEVDGWREQPIAGDEVLQAVDEHQGQAVASTRAERLARDQMAIDMDAINESRRLDAERREAEKGSADAKNASTVYRTATDGPELVSFIVKGDVSGSVEAVIDSITSLGNAEIATRILRHGVGAPSEFDVQHAADAAGHIISFNTAIPNHVSQLAESKGVRIFNENIIYRVVENVKTMMEDRLTPRISQRVVGEGEIAMVFEIGLGGKRKLRVAGSKVRNGIITKGSKVKVFRKGEVVYDGTISSLKNQKKDVVEMRKDSECGVSFAGWEDFKEGDKVQCYEEESHRRTL
ncbi:initiation factor 2 [Periconia macrospinosa]|uniref:Translation initiation factor IF-2, mitochondrial n=1 Tax=Periconia macrospinosa TaxID=97972 RepID=A0A2V1DBB4_9PLEO|nr:initiation factor 2 [Periconia macrospinosa]